MAITKVRTLDFIEQEWGTYVARFHRLPAEVQAERVKNMGYESFRDMLAHILAWWEEGMNIIRAIAEGREFERKKYDYDAFNAEAVARYKTWEEAKFMAHFESTRQQMHADLAGMDDSVFENRRVRAWLNGLNFHHAREHLVALDRFLTLDVLENEWAEYVQKFDRLDVEKQKEFLAKQGVESFHEMLGHIIGWWEEGIRIINGILHTSDFTWTDPDVDPYNVSLKEKFAAWSEADLLAHFERTRLSLIELVNDLPEDAFNNRDIEGWLAADVVEHLDEHAVPG